METSEFLTFLYKQFRLFLVTAIFLTSTGCVSYGRVDGPYEGKVIDAQTGLPIEGAVVLGDWSKAHPGAGGASHTYYESMEVLTNKNGEFSIPGLGMLLISNIEEMDITIFKAGYKQIRPTPWSGLKYFDNEIIWQGNKPTIRLKRLTMDERRKRGVTMPLIPGNMQKLLRVECNKENIEIGRPSNTLYPVE